MQRNKPCDRAECQAEANAFHDAIYESGWPDERGAEIEFLNCGRCGIECCEYHATARVTWFEDGATDETFGEHRKSAIYDPSICHRCSWLADNAGEHGREPGWRATRSEIPW